MLKICYYIQWGRLVALVPCHYRPPQAALAAIEAVASGSTVSWSNLTLPFDTLTYHLRSPEHSATVGSVQPGAAWVSLDRQFASDWRTLAR
jgi:hypothetical protein